MASPFAVVPNPADATSHLLFFLSGTTQQLGMEVRPVAAATTYVHFVNNGLPQGIINNPTSLAATVLNGAVSVYGLATITTTTGASKHTNAPAGEITTSTTYISTLSPVFDPISTDPGVVTTLPGLAACASPDGTTNWVYFLQTPDTVHYYIYEFSVDGTTTTPNPPFLKTIPSTNSHLAAVTFNGQGDRFIMYANTDGTADNNGIYYVNSSDLEPHYIDGTVLVATASPLAAASYKGEDSAGPFVNICLYYTDPNHNLVRVCGTARETTITWFANAYPSEHPSVDPKSLIAVATDGTKTYIYFLAKGQKVCGLPFTETIESSWFTSSATTK